MEKENPIIEWVEKNGEPCLKFTFNGRLLEEDAIVAIEKWRNAFTARQGEKINIIWNCLNMSGYDSGARRKWQEALKEMKDQIKSIWLVSTSPIIKTGALVMRVFTSLDIQMVESEDEIRIK